MKWIICAEFNIGLLPIASPRAFSLLSSFILPHLYSDAFYSMEREKSSGGVKTYIRDPNVSTSIVIMVLVCRTTILVRVRWFSYIKCNNILHMWCSVSFFGSKKYKKCYKTYGDREILLFFFLHTVYIFFKYKWK
jgi:hypothetical protein